MSRTTRLAHELVNRLSALEGFEVVPPSEGPPGFGVYGEEGTKTRAQHYRVVTLPKTKKKLETWFKERDIPIRIVYAEKHQAEPIHEKGVITFVYRFMIAQGPPTAWMIVHNLSHAIFDEFNTTQSRNPHMFQEKHGRGYYDVMHDTINKMGLGIGNPLNKGDKIYPTTRSQKTQNVENVVEGFHELFAQWVATGQVRLDHPSQYKAEKWEAELDNLFRTAINKIAQAGVVLYNV